MKVIMVTGGAGFIGSNFIRYWLETFNDDIVINYDKLTYAGNLANVKELDQNPRYYFSKGDICDRREVNKILAEFKPDFVINFAAESHVDRSIDDPMLFERTNVGGTLTLLQSLKDFWQDDSKTKRFLQVSTDEVYGSLPTLQGTFSEDSNLKPNSPYSASKAGADMMVRAFVQTYGFPAMITRCCNNYGSFQHQEKFVPTCIIKALNNEPIPIYGDGTNVREWIHVWDHCAALATVLMQGEPGEVYNIGSGEEVSNMEMAKLILEILGRSADGVLKVADRPGHDWRYALDSGKIQNKLGWKCRYSLKDGIKETIGWYQNNSDLC